MPKPTAIVYIDGLNLYRRLVDKVSGDGWVDYWLLATSVLPNFKIVKVRVFTSTLATEDPTLAEARWQRQVQLQPELSIHVGRIKKTTRLYPLTASQVVTDEKNAVKVLKYEEKGSDVELGSRMVLDATRNLADVYLLMSSDTDFAPTLKILKIELGVQIGVLATTDNFRKLFSNLEPNVIRHVKAKHVIEASVKKSEPLISQGLSGQSPQ